MLEFIVEIVGELILQAVGEALFEMGLHSLAEPFQKRPNPWLAAIGYGLFGAVAGGLSLLVFPNILVDPSLRLANLLVTPLLVGGLMAVIGAWRTRRNQHTVRLDKFAYGFLFALTLGLVRFFFAG